MAVTVIGTSTAWTDGGTTVAATPHASTAVGDVVLAFFGVTGGSSLTLTGASGYTLLGVVDENGGGHRLGVYYKQMAAAGDIAEATFQASASRNLILALVTFRGHAIGAPIGTSATDNPAATTSGDPTVDAPSITPTRDGGQLVCAFSAETNTTWSTPGGMTEQCDFVTTAGSANASLAVFTEATTGLTATGTRTSTAATGDSDSPVVYSIFVQPPAGGGFFSFGMNT